MKGWIDFKGLREALSFEQVLRHYGVEIRRKGNQHHGFCPLPKHSGKRRSPSFSANLERGIFQCFGCGAKGNVLEFAALMEGKNPADGKDLRSVALALAERFGIGTDKHEPAPAPAEQRETPPSNEKPVAVNTPLDFELKGLDYQHPYLRGRGFSDKTIEHFGIGYAARGLFKQRIAIPLHDADGRLIGYAGRVVDDSLISEDMPRYKFPPKRERDGTIHEFRKMLFLYNGFRMKGPLDELIVVEGFTSVWWLHQCELTHVVATMGADCSDKQAELIVSLVKPTGRVWIMPDGDEAGERCAESLLRKISPHRFVRWVKLRKGEQPTDVTLGNLRTTFLP